MKEDLKFSVHKRGDRYVLIAREYGVVVWAEDMLDLASGVRELEERVRKVAAHFSEAGVSLPALSDISDDDTGLRSQPRRWWEDNLSFVVKTSIAVIILTGFIVVQALLLVQLFGASTSLRMALEHPALFLVRLGDRAERMSPSEMADLRNAIRRMADKVSPLIEEISQSKDVSHRSVDERQRPSQ